MKRLKHNTKYKYFFLFLSGRKCLSGLYFFLLILKRLCHTYLSKILQLTVKMVEFYTNLGSLSLWWILVHILASSSSSSHKNKIQLPSSQKLVICSDVRFVGHSQVEHDLQTLELAMYGLTSFATQQIDFTKDDDSLHY